MLPFAARRPAPTGCTNNRRLPAHGPPRSGGIRLITRRGNDWTQRYGLRGRGEIGLDAGLPIR